MESVHGGVSTMLFTIASVANGVDNIQARLDKAFADLDQPIVRIADEVSDLHIALKGPIPIKCNKRPVLTLLRKREM